LIDLLSLLDKNYVHRNKYNYDAKANKEVANVYNNTEYNTLKHTEVHLVLIWS